jgi:hypothetical protein
VSKVTNDKEDPFDHLIQNWLHLAFKHGDNKDLASHNLRPAKSFHIVKTLTEEELQKLEKRVLALKDKDIVKAEKFAKVLEWQRALKDKVMSFALEMEKKATNDLQSLTMTEAMEQARTIEAWKPETLKNKKQTIVFMENVSHLTNAEQAETKVPLNLHTFTKSLLRRFGVEHKDLEPRNVMLSTNPNEPNVFIDPDFSIPFILEDTRPARGAYTRFSDFTRENLKDREMRQEVSNPELRATLPNMDVPARYRTEEGEKVNPLQSLNEMLDRFTGLRRQAKEVHNKIKPPIPKSDLDASLD